VGAYPITQGTLAAANYTITFDGSNLTITPAPLTVTTDNLSKVYGAALPGLSYTASGLVNGDPPSILTGSPATAATASSGVGAYPITRGSLAAGANYAVSFTGGTLTVTPAPLTARADAVSKVYGAAVPALPYSVTGLVNGDTPAVLSGALATTAM